MPSLRRRALERHKLERLLDAKGALPLDRPLGPTDLLATMYRFLGISTDLSPTDFFGRPIPLLPSGEPIREMFG